jgi:hypothetical protein
MPPDGLLRKLLNGLCNWLDINHWREFRRQCCRNHGCGPVRARRGRGGAPGAAGGATIPVARTAQSPAVVSSAKQCSYSRRARKGPSEGRRTPSFSAVSSYQRPRRPVEFRRRPVFDVPAIERHVFGDLGSSIASRIALPLASWSVQRPPIQVRREPPCTTRKFGSPCRRRARCAAGRPRESRVFRVALGSREGCAAEVS